MAHLTPARTAVDASLVVATLGRAAPLRRLLDSLCEQQGIALEVIIVDQTGDDTLRDVLAPYEAGLGPVHLRSAPGLSRARNAALGAVRGDVVAFPDDDCWYAPGVLAEVVRVLQAHPEWDGITGRTVDETGRPSGGRWAGRAGPLTWKNLWWRAVSVSLFLRQRVVEQIGPFDETLGVGAGTPWGSGEELDYLLRVLAGGFRIVYEPAVTIGHPQPTGAVERPEAARAYRYGAGVGRVIRKHRCPPWFVAYMLARPLAGAIVSLASFDGAGAQRFWAGFRGRLAGWSTPWGGR